LQKIPTASYLSKVEHIYKTYRIYALSDGHEQVKFLGGVPRTRSDVILDNVHEYIPDGGDFLDVGTGSGVFLRAVNKRFGARARLNAQDITAAARERLSADLPIECFYAGDLSKINRKFDVISMVHVLEHAPSPLQILEQVSRLLKDDGVLLVQVPDLEETVFDTIIFDHISHFTPNTVLTLLRNVFPFCVVPQAKINNEITVLAGSSARSLGVSPLTECSSLQIDLSRVSKVADFLAHRSEPTAVFGVAPTGTFCGALLQDHLECFVDEDTRIQFKRHLGKVILPPDRFDSKVPVFLPPNRNAATIRSRLDYLCFITEEDSG
jgi:2-polyprenyl-3-methyl-5-hydroxy-6-metoxy-1,4-benzoquinol methylase